MTLLVMVMTFLSSEVPSAQAAEVLQVRGADLLQVGDQNRSYPVRLGCVAVEASDAVAATAWLREALPRRTRVNLRPLGSIDGTLIAQVTILSSSEDLGSGLVREGLAARRGPSNAPLGCPSVASTGGR